MSNKQNNIIAEDWDEFTHTTHANSLSNEEIFKNFGAFRARIKGLPKDELVERGWIKGDDYSTIYRLFFSLVGLQEKVLFRKSTAIDDTLLTIWMSLVKDEANLVRVERQIPSFEALSKEDLRAIAKLSIDVNAIKKLPEILAEKGVILVYCRALSGMKLDGATFKLKSGQIVVGMSIRFSRLDYFWFTLMHELAHVVLLKGEFEGALIFDLEECDLDVHEKAANKLAKESLVDRTTWRNCEPKYQSGETAVRKYASKEGVHPSIVAGLLRKELNDYSRYSKIINEHDVRSIIFER